jgi:hypothetical protein
MSRYLVFDRLATFFPAQCQYASHISLQGCQECKYNVDSYQDLSDHLRMDDNSPHVHGSNPKATSSKVQTNWAVKAAMYRRLSGCSGRLGSLV